MAGVWLAPLAWEFALSWKFVLLSILSVDMAIEPTSRNAVDTEICEESSMYHTEKQEGDWGWWFPYFLFLGPWTVAIASAK